MHPAGLPKMGSHFTTQTNHRLGLTGWAASCRNTTANCQVSSVAVGESLNYAPILQSIREITWVPSAHLYQCSCLKKASLQDQGATRGGAGLRKRCRKQRIASWEMRPGSASKFATRMMGISMDWFKGKPAGKNICVNHHMYGLPVNCAIIQFCDYARKSTSIILTWWLCTGFANFLTLSACQLMLKLANG